MSARPTQNRSRRKKTRTRKARLGPECAFLDPYESILASVGYEYIEEHVLKTCTGEWAEPMLEDLRAWMSEKVVPWMVVLWMLHVYARRASNCMCHFLFVSI